MSYENVCSIEYDNMYPKKITKNNIDYELEWEGKKLIRYGNIEFEYNEEGQRIKKITSDSIFEYIYANGNLIRTVSYAKLTPNSITMIDYNYDETGQVIGLSYNNKQYFYLRDILGNINKIIDKNGNVMVSYSYDGYGNPISTAEGSIETFLLNNNIFLYKGYYYDVETSLFWLSSGYYSPELGRFILPADVFTLDPQSINGLNLYTYANNNPIGIAYRSSSTGGSTSGGIISSITSNVGYSNSEFYGTISNSSNIFGALVSLSTAFAFFDKWSGYLSGVLDGGLGYWGTKGFGIKSLGPYSDMINKFGKGMTIAGNVLSWGSSVYNNFNNPNYSTGEAIGASFMDAAYYTGKGFGTYYASIEVGKAAVGLGIATGASIFLGAPATWGAGLVAGLSIAAGGLVAIGIGFAGAVAIYYLGEWIDDGWEWLKKQIFE